MRKRLAFTLAEVLITLSVIGVVAAITIPQLMKNMNDYAFGKAKENTLIKITEATNQMKSNDVLSGYTTNASFADEFQKYMKINKRCNSSNLTSCFAAKISTSDGNSVDTTTLTTGTMLSSKNLSDNTVALMLANGTSVLLSLRDSTKVGTDCDRIDPFSNTSNTTSCLSILYDINGMGSPNVLGKDIGSVNVTKLVCAGVKTADGTCFSGAFTPTPMSLADCNLAKGGPLGITACYFNTDYWAGAVAHCGGVSNMPTEAQLASLANKLYGLTTCSASSAMGDATGCTGTVLNYSEAAKAGLPSSGAFVLWSPVESSDTSAFFRRFNVASSNRYDGNRNDNSGVRAICLGD